MKRLAVSLLPILLLTTSSSYGLKVYKWRDSEGIHYSDRQPPSMAEDPTRLRIDSEANRTGPIQRPPQHRPEGTSTLYGENSAASSEGVVDNSVPGSGSGLPTGGEGFIGGSVSGAGIASGGSNAGGSSGGGSGGGGSGGGRASSTGEYGGETFADSGSEHLSPASAPLSNSGSDVVASAMESPNGDNAPASETSLDEPTVGTVATRTDPSGSSVGGDQSTTSGGPESVSGGTGSTYEPVEVVTVETLTTTSNEPPAPTTYNESEPEDAAKIETIEVSGSGAISSAVPTPASSSSLADASKYYNSDEPGCDGTDPTVLFCDDFEDGVWAETHCDGPNGGAKNPANDGWCMNIYATWPDPEGTGYGRCGGKGVAGTNCAGTSGVVNSGASYPNGGQSSGVMGQHWFAPEKTSYPEVWVRYYVKQLPGFDMGHEKHANVMFDNNTHCCIMNKYFGSGELNMELKGERRGWLQQNIQPRKSLINNHWFYVEIHLKMESSPGANDGEYHLWMDDCGPDGLGCKGPGTLQASYENIDWVTSSTRNFYKLWMENWGNPGSTGEQYYDQFYVATRRVGPMK